MFHSPNVSYLNDQGEHYNDTFIKEVTYIKSATYGHETRTNSCN